MKMKKLNYLILVLTILMGCSQSKNKSTKIGVTISREKSGDRWLDIDISSTTQINCLGIMVTNPDAIQGQCSHRGNAVFNVSKIAGSIAVPGPGNTGELTIEVPSGPNQEIRIIAFASTTSSECPDMINPDSASFSDYWKPKSILMGRFDLNESEMSLDLDLNNAKLVNNNTTTTQFDTCDGPAFNQFNECRGFDHSNTDVDQIGNGSMNNPHIICSLAQLQDLEDKISNQNAAFKNRHYKLGQDIEIDETVDTNNGLIIGKDENNFFSGVFDGNGHSIIGWTFTGVGTQEDMGTDTEPFGLQYIGLFGALENATIKNLVLVDSSINIRSSGDTKEYRSIAVLAGFARSSTINNIKILGKKEVVIHRPSTSLANPNYSTRYTAFLTGLTRNMNTLSNISVIDDEPILIDIRTGDKDQINFPGALTGYYEGGSISNIRVKSRIYLRGGSVYAVGGAFADSFGANVDGVHVDSVIDIQDENWAPGYSFPRLREVGGVFGKIANNAIMDAMPANSTVTIKNVVANNFQIKMRDNHDNSNLSENHGEIGGIAGAFHTYVDRTIVLKDSYANGRLDLIFSPGVSSENIKSVGGVVGKITIHDDPNLTPRMAQVSNCYSTFTFNENNSSQNFEFHGGIVGEADLEHYSGFELTRNAYLGSNLIDGPNTEYIIGSISNPSSIPLIFNNNHYSSSITSATASEVIDISYRGTDSGLSLSSYLNSNEISPFDHSDWDFVNVWRTVPGQLPNLRFFD